MKINVKVCCISSVEEALIAVSLGVSAIGLVGYMPSRPGVISDDLIKYIGLTYVLWCGNSILFFRAVP